MFGHLMINILLALLWCLLTEQFAASTFIVGYLIGAAVLFVLRGMMGEVVFFQKTRTFLKLLVVFVYEMIVANVQVAWWILRPRLRVQPALIQMPIELETDLAISFLSAMISLTPGTVTVDVAADRKSLTIHCLNVTDIEATKRQIKEQFEKPLRELER